MKGIEAETKVLHPLESKSVASGNDGGYAQIRAQIEKPLDADLQKVVTAWPSLVAPLKAAVLALIGSAVGSQREGRNRPRDYIIIN